MVQWAVLVAEEPTAGTGGNVKVILVFNWPDKDFCLFVKSCHLFALYPYWGGGGFLRIAVGICCTKKRPG